jgi:hypothetical protein
MSLLTGLGWSRFDVAIQCVCIPTPSLPCDTPVAMNRASPEPDLPSRVGKWRTQSPNFIVYLIALLQEVVWPTQRLLQNCLNPFTRSIAVSMCVLCSSNFRRYTSNLARVACYMKCIDDDPNFNSYELRITAKSHRDINNSRYFKNC